MTAPVTAPASRGTRRVTDAEPVGTAPASVSRERRAAARVRDLTLLLQQRPELVGVHLPADLSVEAVSWCA